MNYLKIEGFKCFEKIEIPLKQLNVLAGGNSVGKSSVIQALLLLRTALKQLERKLKHMRPKTPLNDTFLLNLGNSTQILSKKNASDTIQVEYNWLEKAASCEWQANITSPELFLLINPMTISPTDSTCLLAQENFHYLHAERLGPRSFYNIGIRERNVGWRGENTIALLSSEAAGTPLYNVPTEKLFSTSKNPSLRHQVELWMDYIIPGIDINPQRVREINQSYVLYNDNAPYNVGFGISYILPIVVSGLICKSNEMLIVENPEAHLHPSGQSRIGYFLAKVAAAGTQLIIETHSEHVINGIRLACLQEKINHEDVIINFFSRSKEKEEQPVVDSILLNEKADLEKWPVGFFDQQQQDLAQIFSLRKKLRK